MVRLRPFDAAVVQAQIEENEDPSDWPHGGLEHDHGNLCQIGDNFMIPADEGNEEGVEWFILQCTKAKYRVEEDFVCAWGTSFKKGDYAIAEAIAGSYYQKYGRGRNTYVLLNKSVVAHVEAHLVRACKFPMVLAPHTVSGNEAVYKLTSEGEAIIRSSLSDWFADSDT